MHDQQLAAPAIGDQAIALLKNFANRVCRDFAVNVDLEDKLFLCLLVRLSLEWIVKIGIEPSKI